MEEVFQGIKRGAVFTDVHQKLAIGWLENLGEQYAGNERGGPALPVEVYQLCAELAHLAALYGRADVIAEMARSPAEPVRDCVVAPDRDGVTPAHLAARYGHADVIRAMAGSAHQPIPASLGTLCGDKDDIALLDRMKPAVRAGLPVPDGAGRQLALPLGRAASPDYKELLARQSPAPAASAASADVVSAQPGGL